MQQFTDTLRKVQLTASERASVRARLFMEMSRAPTPSGWVLSRYFFRAPMRIAVSAGALCVIAVAGLGVAAEHTLPGDAFYGLKRGVTETAFRLVASMTPATRVFAELTLLERRLREAEMLAAALPPPLPERTEEMKRLLREQIERTRAAAEEADGAHVGSETTSWAPVLRAYAAATTSAATPVVFRTYRERMRAILERHRALLKRWELLDTMF